MPKDPKKQTPQQVFNQFLFDGMMDKLRAVELYEKEVAGFSNQISQHIKDHRENAGKLEAVINNVRNDFEELKGQYGGYNFGNRVEKLESENEAALKAHRTRGLEISLILNRLEKIERAVDTRRGVPVFSEHFPNIMESLNTLQLKMKEQREDYHDHIRQLVTENEIEHKNLSTEISQVAADTNKSLIAHKQIQDVAREASTRQATVITKLHNKIREQGDEILELKKRILAIEEKKAGRPRKVG